MSRSRFITCDACQGEGRKLVGHSNDPHARDFGSCRVCEGERVIEIEVFPIEMEDL